MTGNDPRYFQVQFARYHRATYLAFGVVMFIVWAPWSLEFLFNSEDLLLYTILCSSISVVAIIKTVLVIRKNNRITKIENIAWGFPDSVSEKLPMGMVHLRIRYVVNRVPYLISMPVSLADAELYTPTTLIPLLVDPKNPTHAQPFLDKVIRKKQISSSRETFPNASENRISLTPLFIGLIGICLSWVLSFGLYLAYKGPASYAKFFPIGKYGTSLSLIAVAIYYFIRKFLNRTRKPQSDISIPVKIISSPGESVLEQIYNILSLLALLISFFPNPPIHYQSPPNLAKELVTHIPGNPSTQPDNRKFTLGIWKTNPQPNGQVQTLEFVAEGRVEYSIRPSADAPPTSTQTGTWTFKDNAVLIVLIPATARSQNKPASPILNLTLSEDQTSLTQKANGVVFRRGFE